MPYDKKVKLTVPEKVYIALEALSASVPNLHTYLNESGYAALTVCPHCMVDDFVHVEGCQLSKINSV